MASDNKFFNCSEEHELTYVSNLYAEKTEVYLFLKEKCGDGTIKYLSHEDLYALLKENGYTKK